MVTAFKNIIEGIRAYSHLHGLLPRLGFFVGNEGRTPYDFHEIIASIAPRPILVIAPTMDKDAVLPDVTLAVEKARNIYSLYGAPDNLQLSTPDDFSRYSPAMREKTYEWLQERLQDKTQNKFITAQP